MDMERTSVVALAAGLMMASEVRARGRKENDRLQGEWIMVSRESGGTPWPQEEVAAYRRIIKGYRYTLTKNGITVARGLQIPDGVRTPASVDVIESIGEYRGRVRLGIYELDGDFQQVCLGAPDGKRPTEFAASAESGCWLTVWKRVGK
jgi:uncharacterized protein (TIGR03067 family)